jgi:hypothetical protein
LIWSRSIWSSTVFVVICVRIISITATLVNVCVRFVRTIRFNFASAASMLRVVRCGCGCDCGCVKVLARASENASSKIQQKLKKSKNPPNVDWSGDGWSCGWPVSVDSKRKQKWKKPIIKSWKGLH